MALPDFNGEGDLPEGLHCASMDEVIQRFGDGTAQRQDVTNRLQQIYMQLKATDKLERFFIFGSYITVKLEPNDVDIFVVVAKEFNIDDYTGETRDMFSHAAAQNRFGASIFWVSQSTTPENIDALIARWQIKRDQTRRGVVEVIA